MARQRLVTLLTDFGLQDPYVAAMKGVLLSRCDDVAIVDISHDIEPQNVLAASLNAMTYFKDFSRGMFDTRGFVYFLSAAALFLFLSVKSLESRRWR